MTEGPTETIEQIKARLKREDEKKERAFQKRLEDIKADNRRYRAEKEEEERAKRLAIEKLHREHQEKREQEMKASALHSWVVAGGTEASFEKEWPTLKVEMLRARTLEIEAEGRRGQLEHLREAF
jgi:hypothetical protein